MVEFRPDGPHSPQYTRELADAAAASIRTLNYATQKNGLRYPSDIYDVLGRLAAAAGGHPQALRQMQEWLLGELAQGRAREHSGGHHGGDTDAAFRDFCDHVDQAVAAADELHRHLTAAQSALSGMEGTAS